MRFDTINSNNPLILASASPRREQLLSQLRLPSISRPSHVPEDGVTGDSPQIACLLAEKKAREVYEGNGVSGSWILGADTLVVIRPEAGNEKPEMPDIVLGKPTDESDAGRMLRILSGREHRVITGICILAPSGETAHLEAVTTRVRVKLLSDSEIEAYIRTGEPFGKAGGYAIQGIGSFMVRGISGSYTNVVGLPLCVLVEALLAVGAIPGFPLPDNL
jgi:septum formation protein